MSSEIDEIRKFVYVERNNKQNELDKITEILSK